MDGEELREHDPTIAYQPEALDAEADRPHLKGAFKFALVVEKGPQAGLAYILAPGTTTVGRSEEANIFLDDVTVSRKHANLSVDGDTMDITDVGSLNGTYVNDERVDSARLKPGDEVMVGKYRLVVAHGDG